MADGRPRLRQHPLQRPGKEVWTLRERFPVWSGALATAGDVVFYGTMDGWFKAVHARSGKELQRLKTGSGIIGQPVSQHGGAILSLFTTMIYTGPFWGLTPIEDQQLAGLIMWVPAGLSYLLAALWLVTIWLRDSEGRVVRRERLWAAMLAGPVLLLLALAGCESRPATSAAEAARLTGGNPEHGPPLDGIGARVYVADVLINTPQHLGRWIESPREVDSLTAMPELGVSAADSRDIAAFLYTRR